MLDKYLKSNTLKVTKMDKGTAWLDTGTFSSLMQASQFVQVLEKRQGLKVGCIEEVAYKMGYINSKQLKMLANRSLSSGYGKYLISLVDEKNKLLSNYFNETSKFLNKKLPQEDLYKPISYIFNLGGKQVRLFS